MRERGRERGRKPFDIGVMRGVRKRARGKQRGHTVLSVVREVKGGGREEREERKRSRG